MKNAHYIIIMGIASGLLIFAMVNANTNAGDILKGPIEEAQIDTWIPFENQEESKESQLEAIGSFRFKLTEEQIKELDCWNKPLGYEIVLTIDNDMYFFTCPGVTP